MAWSSGLSAGGMVVVTPLISMVAERSGLQGSQDSSERQPGAVLDLAADAPGR